MKSPSYSNRRDSSTQQDSSLQEGIHSNITRSDVDHTHGQSATDLFDFYALYKDDNGNRTLVKAENAKVTVKIESEKHPWLDCSVKEAFTLGHLLIAAAAATADDE